MDFDGFRWILMDFDRIWWISMDFDGFRWISMDFDGFWWISMNLMDFDGFRWISMDFDRFWWILMNFRVLVRTPRISRNWAVLEKRSLSVKVSFKTCSFWPPADQGVFSADSGGAAEAWGLGLGFRLQGSRFSLDFDQFWWILMDFDRFWWILMDFDEFWWILIELDEF